MKKISRSLVYIPMIVVTLSVLASCSKKVGCYYSYSTEVPDKSSGTDMTGNFTAFPEITEEAACE
jgi:hypothetical protein